MTTKPKQPKKSVSDFLFKAVIYTLLIAGIIYAFLPHIGMGTRVPERVMSATETADYQASIGFVTPQEVVAKLRNGTQPSMLVMYASWCGYCKLVMPSIFSLWHEGKTSGVQLVFVSLDYSITPLANYLLAKHYQDMIVAPRILRNVENMPSLPEYLRPLGSRFTGGIPYIGFYDKDGKMVQEIHGFAFKPAIEKSLSQLVKQ